MRDKVVRVERRGVSVPIAVLEAGATRGLIATRHASHVVGALAGRHGWSALANARNAARSLAAVVAERSELTRRLRTGADDRQQEEPGTLTLLTPDECHALLARCGVGRLAYIARLGVPDVTPVNYVLDGDDIVIRTGPGPKLEAAERRERVAFEVDDLDDSGRAGWSVVVHGLATRLSDLEQHDLGVEVQPAAAGPRRHVIRIRPERVSGRRLS